MAVPDTTTFSLQDVVDEINPTTDDLNDCRSDSVDAYFDIRYKESKMNLLNFRNYNGTSILEIVSVTVLGTTMYVTVVNNFSPIAFSNDNGSTWTADQEATTGTFEYEFTGITPGTYNIKARDYKGTVLWSNNPVVVESIFWYLPSKTALLEMYTQLHLNNLGNFQNAVYWSSYEGNSYYYADWINFSTGAAGDSLKNDLDYQYLIRPVRQFSAAIGLFEVGDVGPAGGLIFYCAVDGVYLEAYFEDIGFNIWWDLESGWVDTNNGILSGGQNTFFIISESGVTISAAGDCADLVSYGIVP